MFRELNVFSPNEGGFSPGDIFLKYVTHYQFFVGFRNLFQFCLSVIVNRQWIVEQAFMLFSATSEQVSRLQRRANLHTNVRCASVYNGSRLVHSTPSSRITPANTKTERVNTKGRFHRQFGRIERRGIDQHLKKLG